MPSDKAQQIMNRGMGTDSTEAAPLIREATDEILLEVLAGASQHGNRLAGVVEAVQAEIQRRAVRAQIASFSEAAAAQIGALSEVEGATRDQIEMMQKLDRGARWLAIAIAVFSSLFFLALWCAERV